MALADSVSDETCFLDSCLFFVSSCDGRMRELSEVSFIRALISFMRSFTIILFISPNLHGLKQQSLFLAQIHVHLREVDISTPQYLHLYTCDRSSSTIWNLEKERKPGKETLDLKGSTPK